MKQLVKYYILVLLISLYSCKDCSSYKSTSMLVFIDCTEIDENSGEIETINSNIDKLITHFDLETSNMCNSGIIKLIPLYDFSSSVPISFSIEKGKGWDETDYVRSNAIKSFKDSIISGINTIVDKCERYKPKKVNGYDKSILYENLSIHIKQLDNESSDNKIIVIFSDLLENSNLFSLYQDCSTKNDEYEKIYKRFDKINKLNFENKKVFVVYSIFDKDIEKFKEKESKIKCSKIFWTNYFKRNGIKENSITFLPELH